MRIGVDKRQIRSGESERDSCEKKKGKPERIDTRACLGIESRVEWNRFEEHQPEHWQGRDHRKQEPDGWDGYQNCETDEEERDAGIKGQPHADHSGGDKENEKEDESAFGVHVRIGAESPFSCDLENDPQPGDGPDTGIPQILLDVHEPGVSESFEELKEGFSELCKNGDEDDHSEEFQAG